MFSSAAPPGATAWERVLPVLLRGGSEETQSELSLRLTLTPSGAPSQPGRVRLRRRPPRCALRVVLTHARPRLSTAAAPGGDLRGGPVLPALAGAERGGLREPEGGAEHPGGLCNLPGQDCGPALPRLLLRRRAAAPVRAGCPSPGCQHGPLSPARARSFQAVLRASSGSSDSSLSVVETNHFKNLTHLTLRLRPGNDAAVKQARRARAGAA